MTGLTVFRLIYAFLKSKKMFICSFYQSLIAGFEIKEGKGVKHSFLGNKKLVGLTVLCTLRTAPASQPAL
jgi:hypothetical protein